MTSRRPRRSPTVSVTTVRWPDVKPSWNEITTQSRVRFRPMRQGGVREEGAESPAAAIGVVNGSHGSFSGLKRRGVSVGKLFSSACRRYSASTAQQLIDRRFAADRLRQPRPRQPSGQGILETAQPLGADARLGESPVVGRPLQLFQRRDAETFVQRPRQVRADAGQARQQPFGVDVAARRAKRVKLAGAD